MKYIIVARIIALRGMLIFETSGQSEDSICF